MVHVARCDLQHSTSRWRPTKTPRTKTGRAIKQQVKQRAGQDIASLNQTGCLSLLNYLMASVMNFAFESEPTNSWGYAQIGCGDLLCSAFFVIAFESVLLIIYTLFSYSKTTCSLHALRFCVGYLWVLWLPPTLPNHACQLETLSVDVSARCEFPAMDWLLVLSVFPVFTVCLLKTASSRPP